MGIPAGPGPIRLNLGSGRQRLEGYTTVDAVGEPDIKADVRQIPLEPGSVDEILAVHLFEHLPRWETEKTLAHWFALLRPGGRLVLELPDLTKCCQNILAGQSEQMGIWGLYGDPKYETEIMCHRWGWTSQALGAHLQAAGFRKVKVLEPQWHKKLRDMRLEALK